MSAQASHRHLHLVVDNEGQVVEPDCKDCRGHLDVISGLERDLRSWMMRYRELERDKAAEAREHPMWLTGERLFREWRTLCKHPNSKWTPDRFWDIEPFLCNGKYGGEQERIDLCRRAIAGAAFDAFQTRRKNGSVKRHDDWDLIFRNASKFEEFCNRAPLGWTP